MKSTTRLSLLAGIICLVAFVTAQAWFWKSDDDSDGEPVTEIYWENLVPDDFVPMQNPLETMSTEEIDKLFDGSEESNKKLAELEAQMAYAPVNETLDGQRVRLPGYVVPLDFDGQTKMNEFLLVPYFGACIHTPPPPANQVVHATAVEAVEITDTYSPVWATGKILTQTRVSDLAETGYLIEIEKVEPYTEQQ